MAETYIYDSSTHVTKVRDQTVELTETANAGQVGNSRLVIEDATGNTTITGHKTFRVHQSNCSVINVFRGFVGGREYNRAESERTQTARHISLTLLDLNAKLGFKIIRGAAWRKRPKETIGERLTAMLAADFCNGIHDNGFVNYPDYELDGGDLRGQFPGDVIGEMAEHVGFNWFIYWDESATEASLWFQDSNTSTDWSSTLRISDVASDVDGTTTFAPAFDTKLSRAPDRTVSGVWLPFERGNVYRTRAATEATYEPRDGTAPNANVKRRAKARNLGDRYLRAHSTEEDQITTVMKKVPDTKVNLIRAGQRIEAKFTSFDNEGYGAFTWFRVAERTVRPLVAEGSIYDIDLVLSPQEAGASACTIGVAQTSTEKIGTPNPTGVRMGAPVTAGSLLVVYVCVHNEGTTPPTLTGSGWQLLWTLWPFTGNRSPGRLYAKIADGSAADGGTGGGLGEVTAWSGFDGVVAAEFTSTCGWSSAIPTDTEGDPGYGGSTAGPAVTITKTVDVASANGLTVMVTNIKSFGAMTLTQGGSSSLIGLTQGAPADHPAIMVYRTGTGSLTNTVEFDPAVQSDWASVAVAFEP